MTLDDTLIIKEAKRWTKWNNKKMTFYNLEKERKDR